MTGNLHTNQVISLLGDDEKVYSTGLDDSFRSLSVKDNAMEYFLYNVAMPSSESVLFLKDLQLTKIWRLWLLVREWSLFKTKLK